MVLGKFLFFAEIGPVRDGAHDSVFFFDRTGLDRIDAIRFISLNLSVLCVAISIEFWREKNCSLFSRIPRVKFTPWQSEQLQLEFHRNMVIDRTELRQICCQKRSFNIFFQRPTNKEKAAIATRQEMTRRQS